MLWGFGALGLWGFGTTSLICLVLGTQGRLSKDHLVRRGEAIQLARRLDLALVDHLHALHPDDESELRNDVQHDPTHFDEERVSDYAEALHTQAEPHREREPGDDQEDRELAVVGVTMEKRLLTLAVLLNLKGIVEEHDAGQA